MKTELINTISQPQKQILQTIQNPSGVEKFIRQFHSHDKTVIIVPDKTRKSGANLILPVLLQKLRSVGIQDHDVKIILANGSHPFHSHDEIERIVGKEVFTRIEIIEHNCYDAEEMDYLGDTIYGTRVCLNRHVLRADRRIVVSTAVHHYFAGFGGGPKMLIPGCAGYETIVKNHALSIDAETGSIHPNCRAGIWEGNPVLEDILDATRFIQTDFMVETILNEDGRIIDIVFGDLVPTHKKACKMVDAFYKIPIEQKADLVVVSCGGFPKDINLIQSHKSINNAFFAVKEGGVILVLAECRDGIGSKTFLDWFQISNEEAFIDELTTNYKLNGTTALSLKMKTKSSHVILVSTLPAEIVTQFNMIPAPDVEAGWQKAQCLLPGNFTSFIIPNGSVTVPII